MMTDHILSLLIQERDRLNQAIAALQGTARRPGRPPKAVAALVSPSEAPRKRKPMSAATRRKMAAAQKKRWAAAKKAE
jgi:hypothetical protein